MSGSKAFRLSEALTHLMAAGWWHHVWQCAPCCMLPSGVMAADRSYDGGLFASTLCATVAPRRNALCDGPRGRCSVNPPVRPTAAQHTSWLLPSHDVFHPAFDDPEVNHHSLIRSRTHGQRRSRGCRRAQPSSCGGVPDASRQLEAHRPPQAWQQRQAVLPQPLPPPQRQVQLRLSSSARLLQTPSGGCTQQARCRRSLAEAAPAAAAAETLHQPLPALRRGCSSAWRGAPWALRLTRRPRRRQQQTSCSVTRSGAAAAPCLHSRLRLHVYRFQWSLRRCGSGGGPSPHPHLLPPHAVALL